MSGFRYERFLEGWNLEETRLTDSRSFQHQLFRIAAENHGDIRHIRLKELLARSPQTNGWRWEEVACGVRAMLIGDPDAPDGLLHCLGTPYTEITAPAFFTDQVGLGVMLGMLSAGAFLTDGTRSYYFRDAERRSYFGAVLVRKGLEPVLLSQLGYLESASRGPAIVISASAKALWESRPEPKWKTDVTNATRAFVKASQDSSWGEVRALFARCKDVLVPHGRQTHWQREHSQLSQAGETVLTNLFYGGLDTLDIVGRLTLLSG